MKVGLAIAGLVGLLGVAIIATAEPAGHSPPLPPTPPRPPVPPSPPRVSPPLPLPLPLPLPQAIPGLLDLAPLELGALYTFMVSTVNGSQQELIANLGRDGWSVIAIHEVIGALPLLRPPFDFVVDGAIWQGDTAAEQRLAQDMIAGKFLITTPPVKTTLPRSAV